MLSVFMTPWTKPTSIHCATSDGLRGDHALEQREVGVVGRRRVRVVPGDRVVGEPAQQVDVAGGARVLEAADAQVAAGHPGEDRPRLHRLAAHRPAGRDHGERARRRDAQGVHRLADHVLAQHRADHRQAVAATGERRAAGPLQVQVAQRAVPAGDLAEQERPPVAEPRVEAAELVAGVGLRHRRRPLGHAGADEHPQAVGAAQLVDVEPEVACQRLVEGEQPRLRCVVGLPRHRQLGQLAGEPAVQADARSRGHAHQHNATRAFALVAHPLRGGLVRRLRRRHGEVRAG
jgi:hypothetical protein